MSDEEFEKSADKLGWGVCNCAACNKPISSSARGWRSVAGRIKGRPYCRGCLAPERGKVRK